MADTFSVFGGSVASVFGLAGATENAATLALGWTLAKSGALRAAFVESCGVECRDSDFLVELQRHDTENGGFTDIELRSAGAFHVIVEAKRGWVLPTENQLSRYAHRMSAGSGERRIVSLSAASREYASKRLPAHVGGVPVDHIAWSDLLRIAEAATGTTRSFEERLWLRELSAHLRGYATMQTVTDNNVYVLVLSKAEINSGTSYTWIDVVEKDSAYFHPYGVGGGWPVTPPNYLGFRYDARLQAIYHVESYEIVTNLADVNPLWCETTEDHIVYRLGPPMRPMKLVKTGNIFKNGRVWCAIDTLLSGAFETISAARDETQRRLSGAR